MATKITRAHEVERLAQPIIEQHHPDLRGAQILYCFTTAKRTRHGQVVYATAQKLSPLHRYLSTPSENSDDGAEFLILVSAEEWPTLGTPQKKALVDHELAHCTQNEDGDWALVGHDLEEFRAIVERHGLWRPEVKEMADTMAQLSFSGLRVPAAVA